MGRIFGVVALILMAGLCLAAEIELPPVEFKPVREIRECHYTYVKNKTLY